MINTYQNTLALPRAPSDLHQAQPVLIPTLPSAQRSNKGLIRFLVAVAVLHFLLSAATFIYLFYQDRTVRDPSTEKRANFHTSDQKESSLKALARLIVKKPSHILQKKQSGFLQWDTNQSELRNINLHNNTWLTILHPGEYYVYSKVTFTKGDPVFPLLNIVKLKESVTEEETVMMQSSCSLQRSCTATQGEVFSLKKGNQLSVWVENTMLVNYDESSTTFGTHKL